MPDINNLTQQDPEQIQQQIEETRSSIAEKLEALEGQVRDTVQSARETVEDTIQSARETVTETVSNVSNSVQETVETVKETFDLKLQVQRHPWPMVGGAFVVGLVAGRLTSSSPTAASNGERAPSESSPWTAPAEAADRVREDDSARNRPGFLDQFSDEVQQIKGIAIGYAVGALRDFLKQSFPALSSHLDDMSRSITTKLGGEPVNGPVFGPHAE